VPGVHDLRQLVEHLLAVDVDQGSSRALVSARRVNFVINPACPNSVIQNPCVLRNN
jgi:hypothetical protein